MNKNIPPGAIEGLQRTIISATEEINGWLRGREVVLLSSMARRYRGREGVITHVTPNITHGCMALVMVWNNTCPGQFLNSDRLTRSYWPLKNLQFTGRKFAPKDCATGWVKVT